MHPQADEIERIDIATYRFASVMRNPDPSNYFASKYSLPHAAAAMVARGSAGFTSLDDSALQDPAIMTLGRPVHVTEDTAMTTVAPWLRPARVYGDPDRRVPVLFEVFRLLGLPEEVRMQRRRRARGISADLGFGKGLLKVPPVALAGMGALSAVAPATALL